MAANADYRDTFINNLLTVVEDYNLDGVDLDWEYPDPGTEATNFSLLMCQLADSLHADGKLLTAAVISRGDGSATHRAEGILDSVFPCIDFLNIMAYDAGSPHSTYAEANSAIQYWLGRGLPASKTILGVPFYGRDPYTSYRSLVEDNPLQAPYRDQIGTVKYNGVNTMKNKTELAMADAGGIMIWEISQDTDDNTSLLKV